MTVTSSPRLGLTRWSADGDPQDRVQFDNDNAQLEDLAAVDEQDVDASVPLPGVRGRWFWNTTKRLLSRDTGTEHVFVATHKPPVAYTPVVTANVTNPAFTGGTHGGSLVGRWRKIDRHVFGEIKMTVGTLSNPGSGLYLFTLPEPVSAGAVDRLARATWRGVSVARPEGVNAMHGGGVLEPGASTIHLEFPSLVTAGDIDAWTSSSFPSPLKHDDEITISFDYESDVAP